MPNGTSSRALRTATLTGVGARPHRARMDDVFVAYHRSLIDYRSMKASRPAQGVVPVVSTVVRVEAAPER